MIDVTSPSFPFLTKISIDASGKKLMQFFNQCGCQNHIACKRRLYHKKFLHEE